MHTSKSPANDVYVDRLFTELDPSKNRDREQPQPMPLRNFYNRNAFVVIGDPGAGKTESFKKAAKGEVNAQYTTVRNFLNLKLKRFQDKTLFLDALDEMRSRSEDGMTVIDRVQARLDELDRPRFRLSCRAQDWYGDSDINSLATVAPDRKLVVLKIEPLGITEIKKIVSAIGADPQGFIEEAKNKGVYSLLDNPLTLKMILKVVGQGQWPKTRSELFKKATEILSKEENKDHRRSRRTTILPEQLFTAAGYLSTVILCAGLKGVALEEGAADSDFISTKYLGYEFEHLDLAARSRLFSSQGAERVSPRHRAIAEYLAAEYLSSRISDGLPIKRIISLITGYDGGTLSDLRGVYAWLICFCNQHAYSLISIDPLDLFHNGDIFLLTPSDKRQLIYSSVDVVQQNRMSYDEIRDSKYIGSLASPEMESVFREILEDKNQPPVALDIVIKAIYQGRSFPSLGNLLLRLARDDFFQDTLRLYALETFERICPEKKEDLRALLDDIHAGHVQDTDCSLRGMLLGFLYPEVVGPDEIAKYLIEEPSRHINEYTMWVGHNFVPATPSADIPKLIDMIDHGSIKVGRRHRHIRERLIGSLLLKGLDYIGDSISPERLYRWLGLSLDKYDRVALN